MAVIKILPKSIFSISNNNNIKNNKIKGVNANVSTVAYTNFEVGQGDMHYSIGASPVKEYTVISDWYKTKLHINDTLMGHDLYSALRYRMNVRCYAVSVDFNTEEYIDRNYLICNGQVGNLFDNSAIWAEYSKMPVVDSNSSPFSTFAIQTPTSLGTIGFEREGSSIQSTTITGELSSDDISAITTSLKEYIKNNMFFAEVFTESTTQIHISTKVFFIGRATMTFDLAQEVVAVPETPSNYDDPTKWEYYATDIGKGGVAFWATNGTYTLKSRSMKVTERQKSIGISPFYKIDSNVFLRTDLLNTSGEEIFNIIANGSMSDWQYGKQTVTLKCEIGEYNDTDGNLALSTQNNSLPMFFHRGDIIEPYIVNGKGQTIPLAVTTNSVAKQFEVINVRLYTSGACWQDIEIQEKY